LITPSGIFIVSCSNITVGKGNSTFSIIDAQCTHYFEKVDDFLNKVFETKHLGSIIWYILNIMIIYYSVEGIYYK